ncbi:hypothetical protein DICPUDRAFT_86484 [Dictyostelium purpureum]|uniref:Uncharacterized protein n=1 Tax=Dictyostelium purpureum TaxID=5786 RepID=F0ZBX1_DICPU|nr:uncharacterized protein DICPUDRAFT_86484 [Dictyostelium purpureum]EGC38561.1 hypothetical protein DICPUDRAFT_86484 [Dictyostelium purpureum]|eukprot:XP_003284932.1 hypothetical protein DICPUDRAFT_86484 [Dictyostelium purpureum]
MEDKQILPSYLEKVILSFLVNEINIHNKEIPNFSGDFDKILDKDIEIGELVKSLSLVNWHWFNSVSSLLNVSVDFTHSSDLEGSVYESLINRDITSNTSSKFKLIKNENINYLRLNFSECQIESLSEDQQFKLLNVVNTNTSGFKNLKKLIISNGSSDQDIYLINKINFDNIKIGFLFLNMNPEEGKEDEPLISTNIKEIADLEGTDQSLNSLIPVFKQLKKVRSLIFDCFNIDSYRQLYISLCCDGDENKLSGPNGDNIVNSSCLSYIQNIAINNSQVQTIESLYFILKLLPKMKTISFKICFDNLIKQMDTTGTRKGCICSREDKCNEFFDHYWNGISKMIQEHQHLIRLEIGQHCTYPIAYAEPFRLPTDFVNKFGLAIGNNKSIKSFRTSHLPSSSINLIEFISGMNQTIVYHSHVFLNMSGPPPEEYVKDFNDLVEKYKHIKMFLIDDAFTNSEVLTYNN